MKRNTALNAASLLSLAILLAAFAGCAGRSTPAPATAAPVTATAAPAPPPVATPAITPASAPAAVAAAPAAARSEPPAQAADTVIRFFGLLDDGQFAEAYQISLMPKWTVVGLRSYQSAGLMSLDEFVRYQEATAGPAGGLIAINTIGVTAIQPLAIGKLVPTDNPELFSIAAVPGKPQPLGIYEVSVGGSFETVDDCSEYSWLKRVLVAELPGGIWKVLLPGEPPDYANFGTDRLLMDDRPFAGAQLLG